MEGELVLATPTSAGTTTALIDTKLAQQYPRDVPQLNVWVYGRAGADAANVGLERRASSWDIDTNTLTLYSPGFPAAITAGTYEIHLRQRRKRKLESINAAARQLHLYWYRPFIDESIITTVNTWQYTLPSSQNWARVDDVQIEVNTAQATYPYRPARRWNWRVWPEVSAAGVTTWKLQFGHQPPVTRKLRLFGHGFFADLVNDADVLAIQGDWEGPAIEWIYEYAQFSLWEWESNRQPTGQGEKGRIWSFDRLMRARDKILEMSQPRTNGKINVPGRGDGVYSFPTDTGYLAAFQSEALV